MRDEATLPGLTKWHWVVLKEEELCGLDPVLMAESEIKCTAPALGPECVTAHTAVSDLPFTDTSLIKTETDLVSPNNGDVIKTESPDFMELAFVSHLHPEKVKTEAEGQYVKAGHRELLDMKCADVKSDEVKLESSEVSVSDVMNGVLNGAGIERKVLIGSRQHAGKPHPKCKNPGKKLSKLIQDEVILVGEKLYKFDQCDKSYVHRKDLSEHQRSHSGDKPCKCNACERSFSFRSGLRDHKRIHTGETRYKCDQCEKSFALKYLKDHKRIHSSEKPYKCDQCEKSFCFQSFFTSPCAKSFWAL
ncbi:hypothetical protein GJAV_G00085730 [Gymnothorax javanicus]|nr:hypothetical protein GJAV_G00085730 [Gymnothorax javanicus]